MVFTVIEIPEPTIRCHIVGENRNYEWINIRDVREHLVNCIQRVDNVGENPDLTFSNIYPIIEKKSFNLHTEKNVDRYWYPGSYFLLPPGTEIDVSQEHEIVNSSVISNLNSVMSSNTWRFIYTRRNGGSVKPLYYRFRVVDNIRQFPTNMFPDITDRAIPSGGVILESL